MPTTLQLVVRSTLALLGIGFAALMFVVIATVWLSERAQTHLEEVAAARDLRNAAVVIREALLAAESSQRGYVLTGNEIYLAPYDNAKSTVSAELMRLRTLLSPRPDRAALIDKLFGVVDEKIRDQDRSIALRERGNERDAVGVVSSNRGKALMDEANIYLTALALEGDERLTSGVAEQTSNTRWLRYTSVGSALVIVVVVASVLVTLHRYGRALMLARDEVNRANQTLELRVEQRTSELSRARDRAELLLAEMNHRVANSLAIVSSLVRMQTRELTEPSARAALEETNARIQAVAQMHKHLFTTGTVGEVAADTYLNSVLGQIESSMAANGSNLSLRQRLAPMTLATSDAVYLGIVATEWVTNAFKYAYPGGSGEVRVRLEQGHGTIELIVEDDGVGRGHEGVARGTGLGTRVVNTIAGLMRADVHYRQCDPGTQAQLVLPVRSQVPTVAIGR